MKVIQDVNTDFMGGWCRDTPDGSAFALSQSCGLGIGQRHRVCCLCCRAPRTRPLKVHAVLRPCSMSAPVVFLPIRLHGGEWRTVNTKLFVIPNTPLKMLWWLAPPPPPPLLHQTLLFVWKLNTYTGVHQSKYTALIPQGPMSWCFFSVYDVVMLGRPYGWACKAFWPSVTSLS